MTSLLSKLKYQYNDFKFNKKIFSVNTLMKYYAYSYLLRKAFVKVSVKKNELNRTTIKIRCRNGVDRQVIYYVFFQKFHFTPSVYLNKRRPVILDIGSNIGCTIIDFKIKYPDSIVYGYEMDVDNYDLAVVNCLPFADVHLFNKAVWIKKGKISYNKNDQTDAYSIHSPGNVKNNEVDCISIMDIIKGNNIETVDILKMDIEGAEVSIFNETDLSWLDKVLSLNIEFHNVSEIELERYIQLLKGRGFNASKSQKHWSAIEAIKE